MPSQETMFSVAEVAEMLQMPRAEIGSWITTGVIKPNLSKHCGDKSFHHYFNRSGIAKLLIMKALRVKAGFQVSRCPERLLDAVESYFAGDSEVLRIEVNYAAALSTVDKLIEAKVKADEQI
jgi:DNA-binding transcriptional MerR regulator